jgi:carnosine N-methyltransferase
MFYFVRMLRIVKRLGLVFALVLALVYFLPLPRILLDVACWSINPEAPTRHPLHSSPPPVRDAPTHIQSPLALNPETEKSIRTAVLSFVRYGASTSTFFRRKRARFDKLPDAHRPLADAIGYSRHFEAAQHASNINTDFAMRIAEHAVRFYNLPSDFISRADEEEDDSLLPWSFVNDALDHLLRDWSEESFRERAQVFPPILDALDRHFVGVRGEKRILLPGIGLGRLAHDIADQGTDNTCKRLHIS